MLQLKDLSWPMVDDYLKKNKSIIVPIGSTEQHGPTGLIGTDFMTAESVAIKVGEESNTMVTPSLNFGMAMHHMGFAGTISLKPKVFIDVVLNIIESLETHGFENILFINGHGGNITPMMTAFCESKANSNSNTKLFLENWWRNEAVVKYEKEVFGDQNGTHATCGEVSLTMFDHPKAFEQIEPQNFEVDHKRPTHYPLSAKEFRDFFTDGRMNSNPALASAEHGEKIKELVVKDILNAYKGKFFHV